MPGPLSQACASKAYALVGILHQQAFKMFGSAIDLSISSAFSITDSSLAEFINK